MSSRRWTGLVLACGFAGAVPAAMPAPPRPAIPGGQLQILGADERSPGLCPLERTDVEADIAGFLARVTVKQVFRNPSDAKIEAVYVFPLSQQAAVDDMTMTVGDRRIVGQIREREEARAVYEAAKAAGHVASLLDQERPNIFTQSVANIEPGATVTIEIRYIETVKYTDGQFEWVFPMVVGPRYIPGGGSAPAPMTTGQNTTQVPDASKITPPVTPPGTRAGHDIGLRVTVFGDPPDMLPTDLRSELHDVTTAPGRDPGSTTVQLKNADELPNRDFVLRYRLGGDEAGEAFLYHFDQRGGFFTLVLQPPRRVVPATVVPRELILVLDTSGSMSGFPIEKAKEVMRKLIDTLGPHDTFNLITFSGDTAILWEQPRPANPQNIAAAQKFLAARKGGGGTEMMKAIDAALVQTQKADRGPHAPIRVVCFLTDGYVGNDFEIIAAVEKNAATTRVFSFGIGNSVNRFLLDGMARAGRGAVEYVTLAGEADAAVERFHERVLAPVLTDITIDWGTLPVADVFPTPVPDLFSAQPIVVHGRLAGLPEGTVTLRGRTGAGPWSETIHVAPTDAPPDHAALPSLWARAKVEDLMNRDLAAAQRGAFPDELKKQVVALGLEYRLMTQFTSFVAVEELTVTAGGVPVKVQVPVEMPQGVSYEGVFGSDKLWLAGGLSQGALAGGTLGSLRAATPSSPPPASMGGAVLAEPAANAPRQQARRPAEARDADGAPDMPVLQPAPAPRDKLAPVLRDLAARVTKDGHDGTLTIGAMRIEAWHVDVIVVLAELGEKTTAALKELGFRVTGESKATRLLTGAIDVRKLDDLAKLAVVVRVKPVVEPGTP